MLLRRFFVGGTLSVDWRKVDAEEELRFKFGVEAKLNTFISGWLL
jgi:hypothetical protein